MRLAPGNITDIIFESAGYVDQADKKRLEAELGIDRPLPVQYVVWLGDFVQRRSRQVVPLRPAGVADHQAAAAGDARAGRAGHGLLGAARRADRRDQRRPPGPARSTTRCASCRWPASRMPSFWLGHDRDPPAGALAGLDPVDDLRLAVRRPAAPTSLQFLLPALAVGYRSSALIMRITRSTMLEVLREDYIRTAWAKGQRGSAWSCGATRSRTPRCRWSRVIGIEFAFLIGGLDRHRDGVQPARRGALPGRRHPVAATTRSCRTWPCSSRWWWCSPTSRSTCSTRGSTRASSTAGVMATGAPPSTSALPDRGARAARAGRRALAASCGRSRWARPAA